MAIQQSFFVLCFRISSYWTSTMLTTHALMSMKILEPLAF